MTTNAPAPRLKLLFSGDVPLYMLDWAGRCIRDFMQSFPDRKARDFVGYVDKATKYQLAVWWTKSRNVTAVLHPPEDAS